MLILPLISGPFLLSAGKRTIKSVASYPDGRNSNTVTKVYYIKESNPVEELERLSLDSQLDNSFSQVFIVNININILCVFPANDDDNLSVLNIIFVVLF